MSKFDQGVFGTLHFFDNRCWIVTEYQTHEDHRARRPHKKSLMSAPRQNVAVLGSTGSIGQNTLEVIEGASDRFRAIALSGHQNTSLLLEQAARHRPKWVVFADRDATGAINPKRGNMEGPQFLSGAEGLEEVASSPEVDIVVAAIVGTAGLRSTWAALETGKTIALANKETLVMAGPLASRLASERGATILPVDSEHSAIFQAAQSGKRDEIKRIILTASGGPFLRWSNDQMDRITVEQALAHPTWKMGPKITVDSATMMNKALEVIEARWLFGLEAERIDVVVHPESMVHSMVEFIDGSIIAQLSPPDMKLPIQYALTYPERIEGPAERVDWTQTQQLNFEPPDLDRFPALGLGYRAAADGGTAGAVLNAANEMAVSRFLAGDLAFRQIVAACADVFDNHEFDVNPTLDQLIQSDRWARQEITKWTCT